MTQQGAQVDLLRPTLNLVGTLLLGQLLASCSRGVEESPAYQAACQGPPLRKIERRNKAMEDGYNVNRQYDCIDKVSFVVVQEKRPGGKPRTHQRPSLNARRSERKWLLKNRLSGPIPSIAKRMPCLFRNSYCAVSTSIRRRNPNGKSRVGSRQRQILAASANPNFGRISLFEPEMP